MWPVERMMIITARPVEVAHPIRVSAPFVFWFTIAAAVPANIRINVPINSAPICNTGGGGGINEQVTVGRAPSSKVHSWTPKHLQFLRRDFLYLLLPFPLLSDLNPPNRGAPGVPGVAGADGISSLLICSISPINSKFNLDKKRSEIRLWKWAQGDCCYCMSSIYSSNKQGSIVDLFYSMIGFTIKMKRRYEKKLAACGSGRWDSQY